MGWPTELVWLHNLSDVLIWLAYLAIPVLLLWFRRRRDLPFRGLLALGSAFILLCGFTHFLEFYTYSTPVYRFSGTVNAVPAVVSWATVIALVPAMPTLLSMRSPRKLQREIVRRRRAQRATRREHRQVLEAERSRNDFFTNVSHELRTPLT